VITPTLSAICLLQADSAKFSVWLHNKICLLITSIFFRLSFSENFCLETTIMARCIFFHLQDTMKILSMYIAYLKHWTALSLQLDPSTLRWAPSWQKKYVQRWNLKRSNKPSTIDIACSRLGVHINDFIIACVNGQVLDDFCARLLDAFEGTCTGALQHYLGCDMDKGTAYLSQTHYAEKILRTNNF